LSPVRTAIGRYRIDRVLGRGGMALVYLGHDAKLGRPVAIKLLADNLAGDESFRARFMREARMAAGLSHVNIVHVYDVGQDTDERPYIVMEYVDGESLAETLAREGRLSPARVREIALDCCHGLEHAHEAGLVHRDIKPHNLLADREGRVKIADFGVARSLGETQLTMAGSVLGSAGYLSPEQAAGRPVTPAADIYSLGATLYELLTGRTPHQGALLTEPLSQGGLRPPPAMAGIVSGVPAVLETAVMSCLEADPERRPRSASALALAIDAGDSTAATRIIATTPPTERTLVMGGGRATPGLPQVPPVLRNLFGGERRARAMGLAIGLLIVLVLAIALLTGRDGAKPKPTATRRTPVTAVPNGATPADDAHNLVAWIRQHTRG
jgi:eukaryotic-like serine/threonine-protein kinase